MALEKHRVMGRWGANPMALDAYAVLYNVWYVGEGVPHLLGQAPCVAAKTKLQRNKGSNEF